MLPSLSSPDDFPAVGTALNEPAGLLAVDGELTAQWLLAAYRRGIFPWFNTGQRVLWWSPDPRMVLLPNQLHVPHSLSRVIRKQQVEIRVDTSFDAVMRACAASRKDQDSTWINEGMIAGYTELYHLGIAHSVEAWAGSELVGGLYGVALGRVFYGESMFARQPDASKIAFVCLVKNLQKQGVELIDCQMYTHHLARFGAVEMPRAEFIAYLQHALSGSPAIWWDGVCDG